MDLVDGKPGAGKGRYFAEMGIQKLVESPETVIITNFAFEIEPWINGHHESQIGLREFLRQYHKHVLDVEKRIYFLTDEQCQEFYRWRVNDAGELFGADVEKNDKGIVQKFDIDICLKARQTMYLIDEAGQMFGSRNWANTGAGVIFYAAQHRKLGDDTQLASQSFKDIDVALVRKCQLFKRCRNRSKLRVGIFRQPEDYKVHVYENPPTGTAGQVPMHTLTFKDDERGRKLLQTFDTTAGVGMRGGRGRGDLKSKKTGIPWKYFLLAMVVVPVVVGAVLNFGMHGLLNRVQHKVAPKLPVASAPAQPSKTTSAVPGFGFLNSAVPGHLAAASDASGVSEGADSDQQSLPKAKPLPFWNLDGVTNLQVVGWSREPGQTRIFLSNGRELPLFVVKAINPYFVLLNDGEFIPVAVVRSFPPVPKANDFSDSGNGSDYQSLSAPALSSESDGYGRYQSNASPPQ